MRNNVAITIAAVLLGVSIADETYEETLNEIANNLCYIQDGLNIFDLRTLSNAADYQVNVTSDVYGSDANLIFNLCKFTNIECDGLLTYGYIQSSTAATICLTDKSLLNTDSTVIRDPKTGDV
jgi:hypothetical protein